MLGYRACQALPIATPRGTKGLDLLVYWVGMGCGGRAATNYHTKVPHGVGRGVVLGDLTE